MECHDTSGCILYDKPRNPRTMSARLNKYTFRHVIASLCNEGPPPLAPNLMEPKTCKHTVCTGLEGCLSQNLEHPHKTCMMLWLKTWTSDRFSLHVNQFSGTVDFSSTPLVLRQNDIAAVCSGGAHVYERGFDICMCGNSGPLTDFQGLFDGIE